MIKFIKSFTFLSVLSLASLFQIQLVFADTDFSYRIRVPKTNQSCEQEAVQLAERFHYLSRIPVLDSKCSGIATIDNEGIQYQFYILDLTYSLPLNRIGERIHSSFYGSADSVIYENNRVGMYLTLNECLNELSARTKEFEFYTSKSALSSTCERAGLEYSQTFVIRIDSLGKPEVQLTSTSDFSDRYNEAPFFNAVEKMIVANQGHIVARRNGHVYYYGKTLVRPYSNNFGSMRESECRSQLKDLQVILRDLNQNEITYSCLHNSHNLPVFTRLEAVLNGTVYLHHETEPDIYSNFSECERDKARAIQRGRVGFNKVKAAICRYSDYTREEDKALYRMDLY